MRLFISYAREHIDAVTKLHDELAAAGHTPWFDKEIHAGELWRKALEDEIKQCNVVIFVMTPESIESKHCADELESAKKRGKPIIPLLLTPVENLPDKWRQMHYIDGRKGIDYATLIPRITRDGDEARTRAEAEAAKTRKRLFISSVLAVLLIVVAAVVILAILPSNPSPETMPVGVAAFTGNCANSASDLQSAIQLDDSTIVFQSIDQSFADSETARAFAQERNLDVLIWGGCPLDANDLQLNIETMSVTSPMVFDLLSLSADGLNLQRAADFSAASLYYASGGTENFQRAAQRLETMQAIPLEWTFLRANSLLFAGYEFYPEALEVYATLQDFEPLRPRVLNNMGVTAFNLAVGYLMRDEYDEFEPTIDAAYGYYADAISATEDAELLNVLHVNLGTIYYFFYDGSTPEVELESYETAHSECSTVETASAYVCRAAARYWQLYHRPASGEHCEPPPNLEPLERDLQSAQNLNEAEPEIYLWRFYLTAFSRECTSNNATEELARLGELANSHLAQYTTLMANRRGLLEIDHYYLRMQPISAD